MTVDPQRACVVGIDYGTLSGRAVVVRVADGAELGTAVHNYRHAVVERQLPGDDQPLPPDWALQVPSDYVDVLREAVPAAIRAAGVDPADIIGVGTDFTACTVLPVTSDGTPLCELEPFAGRPHAYVKLWKHHAAQPQADRINELAAARDEWWLPRYGGLISSEWEFAKGLQILEEDPEIYAATDHLVEAADWIVWQLTDTYVRNACSAGYKGILQDGAYPTPEFLAALNPDFADFVGDKLEARIGRLGAPAGTLSATAAGWTGLPEGIAVAVGNVDAHVTAAAGNAIAPGQMVAIMGTSTCHVMNGETLAEVPGMCGVVDGGITEGLFGYEAGQSGVGDIFGWFVSSGVPQDYVERANAAGVGIHEFLTDLARRSADRGARAHRARLAQWQPLGPRRSRTVRTDCGTDPFDAARGHLPSSDRSDCLRGQDDHRRLQQLRGSGQRAGDLRRIDQEPHADADLRRRHRSAAVGHHLGAGAGPRLGHPRGGRCGRVPECSGGCRRHGQGASAPSTNRYPRTSPSTASCTPNTPCSTTTSGEAAMT